MSDSFSEAVGQPCANPECNFSGHAGFENYCSVCYKLQLNKSTKAEPKAEPEASVIEEKMKIEQDAAGTEGEGAKEEEEDTAVKKVQKNRKRCFDCKKKVGYTGFECRCGFVYCGSHRMPEDHACEFDHKAHGRANLAKTVHKVEASKLNVL